MQLNRTPWKKDYPSYFAFDVDGYWQLSQLSPEADSMEQLIKSPKLVPLLNDIVFGNRRRSREYYRL